jgi:hypothetical protein
VIVEKVITAEGSIRILDLAEGTTPAQLAGFVCTVNTNVRSLNFGVNQGGCFVCTSSATGELASGQELEDLCKQTCLADPGKCKAFETVHEGGLAGQAGANRRQEAQTSCGGGGGRCFDVRYEHRVLLHCFCMSHNSHVTLSLLGARGGVLTHRQMRVISRDMKRINLLGLQNIFCLVAGPLCPRYSRPSVKRFTRYDCVSLTIWVSQVSGQ